MARKEGESCLARLTKPSINRKTFYAHSRPDQDSETHSFIIYGKKSEHADRGV